MYSIFSSLTSLWFFADSCPKPPTNLLCFIGLKSTCTNDTKCVTGTLCCGDGCRKRCRDPSENNRGAEKGTNCSPSHPSPLFHKVTATWIMRRHWHRKPPKHTTYWHMCFTQLNRFFGSSSFPQAVERTVKMATWLIRVAKVPLSLCSYFDSIWS